MASSSIVIKVKFGESLRRLNVSINDKKLVLDMVMLKEKIRSLFSFGSDVEFTMTYVDEDGDAVTLADDDDLHDVVRQSLNPLRITVSLNNSNSNGSSGNITPLMSQNQLSFQTMNAEVAELVRKLRGSLNNSNCNGSSGNSTPLRSQNQLSFQTMNEVAELVQKLRDAYANKILPFMASATVHPATGGPPKVDSESSTVVNPEAGGSNSKKKEKKVQKVTDGVKLKEVQPPRGVDLNIPYFGYESSQVPITSTKSVGEGSAGKVKNTTNSIEKKKDSRFEKKDEISSRSTNELLKNQTGQQLQDQMVAREAKFAQVAADINKNTNDSGSSSGLAQRMLNATNQCPFSGMPLTSDLDSQGHHRRSLRWKKYGLDTGMGNILHRGVCCDGCGVHPITGPRFKSKVKDDYDLCNVCFAGMGNATDYIRINHPMSSFGHPLPSFKGFYDPSIRVPPPMLPPPMRVPESKPSRSKLDSRFILDVNVLDGTMMAPSTAFTKIWRMRNNGSIIWPYGSQLHWIGGDRLSNSGSVNVEIPMDGLLVDKELDIAVDFTAPELPGRYVSYWRMASPSGQKFGQRVWVLIQVDASLKNLGETSINLNLPPVTSDMEAVNQDRLVDSIFSGDNNVTNSENTSVDLPPKDHEMSFPINESLIIDNGGVSSTMATLSAPPGTASSSVFDSTEVATALGSLPPVPKFTYPPVGLDTEPISIPPVDFSVMPPIMSSDAASPPTVVVSGGRVVSDDEEQALVKELEEMGFKKVELNKEVLRMNNYDLEKSVDDLCGVLEWDPMLEELQEMGFADDEANRRLLKKNNGSIKRVVMDLINGENA